MRLPIGIRWQLIACPIMICGKTKTPTFWSGLQVTGGTDRLKSEKLTEYLKNTIIPNFRLYGLANMCMNGPLRRISA